MRNITGYRYRRVAAAFFNTPLAILPAKLAEIHAFLRLKMAGGEVSPERVAQITAARRGDGNGVQRSGRLGIVPVMGVLSQRGGLVENSSEQMVSCEEVGAALDSLVADRACKTIVMLFDSPGGAVSGIPELAAKINSLKSEKKIVGMVDSTCASAAYWLASQCTELNCTIGGMCGSVGVVSVHEDHAGELEKAGVKPTLITSSKYKAEGSPFEPLGDEARAELQSKVDAFHQMFTAAVACGRGVTEGVVNRTFGQGRMLLAKDAKAAGMVDSVATFAQVLHRLGESGDGIGNGGLGNGNSGARLAEGRAKRPYLPLSARLAAVRARAVEVEVVTDAARAAEAARTTHRRPNGEAREAVQWTRQEAAARAAQVARECEPAGPSRRR